MVYFDLSEWGGDECEPVYAATGGGVQDKGATACKGGDSRAQEERERTHRQVSNWDGAGDLMHNLTWKMRL